MTYIETVKSFFRSEALEMNTLFTKFSGWLLLAMLLVEITAVGIFAARWCLNKIFGIYAIAAAALVIALVHEFHAHHRTPHIA